MSVLSGAGVGVGFGVGVEVLPLWFEVVDMTTVLIFVPVPKGLVLKV